MPLSTELSRAVLLVHQLLKGEVAHYFGGSIALVQLGHQERTPGDIDVWAGAPAVRILDIFASQKTLFTHLTTDPTGGFIKFSLKQPKNASHIQVDVFPRMFRTPLP